MPMLARFRFVRLLLAGLSFVQLAHDGTRANVSVAIQPASATVAVYGTGFFHASVSGASNQRTTWPVHRGVRGGTIASNGVYTAPGVAGTYHAAAAAQADPAQAAAIITVVSSAGAQGEECASTTRSVVLAGKPAAEIPLDVNVNRGCISLHFDDENVRSVMFYNGFTQQLSRNEYGYEHFYGVVPLEPAQAQDRRIRARVKLAGQDWKTQDWTQEPSEFFCRDQRSQRIEALELFFEPHASGQGVAPQFLPSTLYISNMGCWRWRGTVEVIVGYMNPFSPTESAYGTKTMNVQVTWERDGGPVAAPTPESENPFTPVGLAFKPVAGESTLQWEIKADAGICTVATRGLQKIPLGPSDAVLRTFHFALAGPGSSSDRGFEGESSTELKATMKCFGKDVDYAEGPGWFSLPTRQEPYRVKRDGISIDEEIASGYVPGSPGHAVFRYHFKALREP